MGADVRARFQPSLALLHGGWDIGCCRIGLAASAGFEEPELTFPCRPGQAPVWQKQSFLPPSPQPPSPAGKGGTKGYFMQGASPLASPRLNPGGTGAGGEPRARRGACPAGCRFGGRWRHPAGACFLCRPPTLPLALFLPPSPHPPSRREWGDQGYFMQGASPLASPRLNPGGTGYPCRCGARGGRGGAEPTRHLLDLPRGRGPSQTPKFLSPGPPSPWLPALFTRAASQLPRSRRVSERHPQPRFARGEAPLRAPVWQGL